MSTLLKGLGVSGEAADFCCYNAAMQVWNGAAYVTWVDGDYATYRVAAAESGTSKVFTATGPDGVVVYALRARAGTLAASVVRWWGDENDVEPTAEAVWFYDMSVFETTPDLLLNTAGGILSAILVGGIGDMLDNLALLTGALVVTTPDTSPSAVDGVLQGINPPTILPYKVFDRDAAMRFNDSKNLVYGRQSGGINCGADGTGVSTSDGSFDFEIDLVRFRTNTIEVIAARWGDTLATQNYYIGFEADSKLYLVVRDGGGALKVAASAATITTGEHNAKVKWTGTQLETYIDGVLSGTPTACTTLQAPDATTPLWLGRDDAESPLPYNGLGANASLKIGGAQVLLLALAQIDSPAVAPTAVENREEMDDNSTKLAAIKAKTDNLPTDPADESLIVAATDAILTAVGTRMATFALPTNFAAILVTAGGIVTANTTLIEGVDATDQLDAHGGGDSLEASVQQIIDTIGTPAHTPAGESVPTVSEDIAVIESLATTDNEATSLSAQAQQDVRDALAGFAPTIPVVDDSIDDKIATPDVDCPTLDQIGGLIVGLLTGVNVTLDSLLDPERREWRPVRGDAYLAADGRAFMVSVTGARVPDDITGSTVWLRVQDKRYREQPLIIEVDGTITGAVGPTKSFSFDITAAQTALLTAPRYQADIVVLIDSDDLRPATVLILETMPTQDARDEMVAS